MSKTRTAKLRKHGFSDRTYKILTGFIVALTIGFVVLRIYTFVRFTLM